MADSKLSALPETTAPPLTDDIYIVTSGSAPDRKATLANVKTAMSVGTIRKSVV